MKRSMFILALASAIAGCATTPPPPASPLRDGIAAAGIGGHARFYGLDVAPIRIEEDSRCPTGVQCIQAGTVRVAVLIDDGRARSERILSLDQPVELEGRGWLSLAAVCPYPRHPETIARAAYRFTLSFARQGPPAQLDFVCPR